MAVSIVAYLSIVIIHASVVLHNVIELQSETKIKTKTRGLGCLSQAYCRLKYHWSPNVGRIFHCHKSSWIFCKSLNWFWEGFFYNKRRLIYIFDSLWVLFFVSSALPQPFEKKLSYFTSPNRVKNRISHIWNAATCAQKGCLKFFDRIMLAIWCSHTAFIHALEQFQPTKKEIL